MAEIDLSEVLRPALLDGVSIVLAHAGGAAAGTAAEVGAVCSALGATVHACALVCSGAPEDDDAAVEGALASALDGASVEMLVIDAAGLFAHRGGASDPAGAASGDRAPAPGTALIAALEARWRMTRAVANVAFIPGGAGGRIVYLAPPKAGSGSAAAGREQAPPEDADRHADAARAGLENLARTLSIEWARYGITPVAIAPGARTSSSEIAGVVAFLASPAGAYFSGCLLDLAGARADG